ncbi:type II secretion system F family protein [Fictibacillus phosphorivorans]|uniref:type II secretion system F family protein n=1 Tax=Fictibacillus phosphorivorans TaxID=1221500 RepID=UPI00203CFD82|nr:type II secretion system F family protein [Fictibacillus phosphorivorans]MCM3719808.1 type II secretion system F family protein [Fictibacillus phosphorivorans]MCM3777521.1 type II secretion system F family protein [Fictibacillus phosphorivorans]
MDTIILVAILFFWVFLFIGLYSWYQYQSKQALLQKHIKESIFYEEQHLRKKDSYFVKLVKRITKQADDFSAIGQRIDLFSESHEVEDWLKKSSFPLDLTVERFQGLKIVLALIGFGLGITFLLLGLPLSNFGVVLLPVGGYFFPIIWLKQKAKQRQDQLRYDLPDFLDTVSVSLQAGIGLDQALREVVKFFSGPLREEFSRFNQEIDLGVEREKAYRNLLARNDNPEFQTLIKSLIQGMTLGVPVATTFKIQAEDMRIIRQEQIKEKAAKASPKITLITTFIVMPTAIFLIGGLMVMNMFMGDNNLFGVFQK